MKIVLLAAFTVALTAVASARAGDLIAHPSVTLDPADIRDVFLGERQLSGDVRLVPVDNVAAQEAFLAAILQTNLRSYQARWTRKVFREGIRPPQVKGSDAEVMIFVRATPGAVGYLTGNAGPGVTRLGRF